MCRKKFNYSDDSLPDYFHQQFAAPTESRATITSSWKPKYKRLNPIVFAKMEWFSERKSIRQSKRPKATLSNFGKVDTKRSKKIRHRKESMINQRNPSTRHEIMTRGARLAFEQASETSDVRNEISSLLEVNAKK